jgi:hypothetical protein
VSRASGASQGSVRVGLSAATRDRLDPTDLLSEVPMTAGATRRSRSALLVFAFLLVRAVAAAQTITEFPVPSAPGYITAGSDGNVWFGASGDKIVRMTTTGNVTEFPLPPHFDMTVYGLTSGPDGNIWYVRSRSFVDFDLDFGRLGRVTPAGGVTEFSFDESLSGITVGPDGNIWFTGSGLNHILRMTTAGQRDSQQRSRAVLLRPDHAGPVSFRHGSCRSWARRRGWVDRPTSPRRRSRSSAGEGDIAGPAARYRSP